MRRLVFGLALGAGLMLLAPDSRGQGITGTTNPFTNYFGYYQPRQQSIAAQLQRGSVASLNVNAADRRASALSQRGGLATAPAFSPYDSQMGHVNPFDTRRPLRPPTILIPGQPSSSVAHPGFYGRTGSAYAYSGLRTGSPASRGR